jgi:hypothetical protein
MNNTTKILILSFLLGSFSSAFAVSEEMESKLLMKAMLESASTDSQRTAVTNYFNNLANAKLVEAKQLRKSASIARGGKMATQNLQKQELLKKAESLEKQAEAYQKLASGEVKAGFTASN